MIWNLKSAHIYQKVADPCPKTLILNPQSLFPSEVTPDPDYRSRLRQDSAVCFRTRIRNKSQNLWKHCDGFDARGCLHQINRKRIIINCCGRHLQRRLLLLEQSPESNGYLTTETIQGASETTRESIRPARSRSTSHSVNTRKYHSFIQKFINIALSNTQLIICASFNINRGSSTSSRILFMKESNQYYHRTSGIKQATRV